MYVILMKTIFYFRREDITDPPCEEERVQRQEHDPEEPKVHKQSSRALVNLRRGEGLLSKVAGVVDVRRLGGLFVDVGSCSEQRVVESFQTIAHVEVRPLLVGGVAVEMRRSRRCTIAK